MKKSLLIMLLLAPSIALAQPPSPPAQQAPQQLPQTVPFAPYAIDLQTHQWLNTVLLDIPAKYSVPIINRLDELARASSIAAFNATKVAPSPPAEPPK